MMVVMMLHGKVQVLRLQLPGRHARMHAAGAHAGMCSWCSCRIACIMDGCHALPHLESGVGGLCRKVDREAVRVVQDEHL